MRLHVNCGLTRMFASTKVRLQLRPFGIICEHVFTCAKLHWPLFKHIQEKYGTSMSQLHFATVSFVNRSCFLTVPVTWLWTGGCNFSEAAICVSGGCFCPADFSAFPRWAAKVMLMNCDIWTHPHSLNYNYFCAWEDCAAALHYACLPSFLFPSVLPAFSHRMHTAGIDPQPTPSLLHSPLWSMTHKAHLTFTQLAASRLLVSLAASAKHLHFCCFCFLLYKHWGIWLLSFSFAL